MTLSVRRWDNGPLNFILNVCEHQLFTNNIIINQIKYKHEYGNLFQNYLLLVAPKDLVCGTLLWMHTEQTGVFHLVTVVTHAVPLLFFTAGNAAWQTSNSDDQADRVWECFRKAQWRNLEGQAFPRSSDWVQTPSTLAGVPDSTSFLVPLWLSVSGGT